MRSGPANWWTGNPNVRFRVAPGLLANEALSVAQGPGSSAVENYAAIRALDSSLVTRTMVLGRAAIADGGQGWFRVDAADAVSLDNGGTILVAADGARWKRILVGPLTPEMFCDGTGVLDTAGFQHYLGSLSGRVSYWGGTYLVGALTAVSLSNCRIFGPGSLSSASAEVLPLLALTNVFFDGPTFATTALATATGLGLVYSLKENIKNIGFRRCTFDGNNTLNTAALSLLPRTLTTDITATLDGVWIEENHFENCGRSGCEIMNRGNPAVDQFRACKNIHFNHNTGLNISTGSVQDSLITLDGWGENFELLDNHADGVGYLVVENTGYRNGKVHDNTGINFGTTGGVIGIDGSINGQITGQSIKRNRTLSPQTRAAIVYNVSDSYFEGNSFESVAGVDPMDLRDSANNMFVGDAYTSDGLNAVLLSSTTTPTAGNRWRASKFKVALLGGASAAAYIGSTNVSGNIFEASCTWDLPVGAKPLGYIGAVDSNYAEGYSSSYLPIISGATTAGTPTYVVQTGTYDVIDGVCHFSIDVSISALGLLAGIVRISLPPPLYSASHGDAQFPIRQNQLTLSSGFTYFYGYLTAGQTFVTIFQGAPSTGDIEVIDTHLVIANTPEIRISGEYPIA